jgi:hypothetical protein
MTTITRADNPYLITMLCERLRPRAEQCKAWVLRAPEVIRRMEAAAALGELPYAIDDGVIGQTPFSAAHYNAVLGLFRVVDSLAANAQVMAALNALVVRDAAVLLQGMALADPVPGMEPAAGVLRTVIRPLAPGLRAMLAVIDDDDPLVPTALEGLADSDLLDDERGTDAIPPVPVGAVRVMHATLQQLASGGVVTDTLARAIDAACTSPMRVQE